MNMLQELLRKKKIRDQKLAKAQDKPKEIESNKPLPKLLNFFQTRQETRLGVLFSLRTKQTPVVEESPVEGQKKAEVTYIG